MRGQLFPWLILCLACLSVPLLPAPGFTADAEAPVDEQQVLRERQKRLEQRILDARREQERLLAQKMMYQTDSKYLVLDLSAGTGSLKYRNRILRSFGLAKARQGASVTLPGVYVLSRKPDGSSRRRALVFGKGFVLHAKGFSDAGMDIDGVQRFTIPSKDLAALYYVLEQGSIAIVE